MHIRMYLVKLLMLFFAQTILRILHLLIKLSVKRGKSLIFVLYSFCWWYGFVILISSNLSFPRYVIFIVYTSMKKELIVMIFLYKVNMFSSIQDKSTFSYIIKNFKLFTTTWAIWLNYVKISQFVQPRSTWYLNICLLITKNVSLL